MATVECRELKQYSVIWRGYSFSIDQEPVANVFVGPEAYTLAWNGSIDFSKIEDQALITLPVRLYSRFVSPQDQSIINVSLAISEHSNIVKYSLSDPIQATRYREDLKSYHRVVFARYDVNWEHSPAYSFIAENPESGVRSRPRTRDYNELAIKLSRTYSLSNAVLEWIFEHHRNRNIQKQVADSATVHDCAALIRQLVVSS